MRIIATSDLHYDVARSKAPTEALAREICNLGGDALMLVGDSASIDLAILVQVLCLFEPFGETLLDFPKVSHVFCGHSSVAELPKESPGLREYRVHLSGEAL